MSCTWKSFKRTAVALTALAAVLVWSLACDTEGGKPVAEPAFTFPPGAETTEGAVVRFPVTMLDNTFDPTELTVPGGATIELNITNKGAAIHNLRLAGADNLYANSDDAVADPPLVNPGETAVLRWLAPVSGGTFDFRCDFHPQAMTGKIVVTPGEESTNGGQEGP